MIIERDVKPSVSIQNKKQGKQNLCFSIQLVCDTIWKCNEALKIKKDDRKVVNKAFGENLSRLEYMTPALYIHGTYQIAFES